MSHPRTVFLWKNLKIHKENNQKWQKFISDSEKNSKILRILTSWQKFEQNFKSFIIFRKIDLYKSCFRAYSLQFLFAYQFCAKLCRVVKFDFYLYGAGDIWDKFLRNADEVLCASGVAGVRYSGISVDEMSLGITFLILERKSFDSKSLSFRATCIVPFPKNKVFNLFIK